MSEQDPQREAIECPHCGVTFNPLVEIQFHKPGCPQYTGDHDE